MADGRNCRLNVFASALLPFTAISALGTIEPAGDGNPTQKQKWQEPDTGRMQISLNVYLEHLGLAASLGQSFNILAGLAARNLEADERRMPPWA